MLLVPGEMVVKQGWLKEDGFDANELYGCIYNCRWLVNTSQGRQPWAVSPPPTWCK